MEEIFNDFISYLFSIGIISKETVNELVSTYQTIIQMNKTNNQEDSFKNSMTSTLMVFFNNLTEDKRKLMNLNIILKFIENQQLKQRDKLKSAIILASRINQRRFWSYYKQWNKVTNTKTETYINNKLTKSKLNTSTMTGGNSKSIHYRLETSWDKREREDFEQCTFHPITNRNRNNNKGSMFNHTYQIGDNSTYTNDSNNKSVYDRLYSDKDKYKLKKELLSLQIDNSQSVNATFTPKGINTATKLKYKPLAGFEDKQKSYASSKSKHKDKIQAQMESEIIEHLTFSPKLNKSYFSTKTEPQHPHFSTYSTYSNAQTNNPTPTYIRLYDDNSRRNQKSIRNKEINNLSINSLHIHDRKSVDYNKIEQLYASFKAKKIKANKIQKEMEKEQGLTFTPQFQNKESIYHKRVNTSFNERNQQFVQNKKAFVDIYHQTEIQQSKERQIGYKKYSKEERNMIAQKIIDRLYKQEYFKHTDHSKDANYSKPTGGVSPSLIKQEKKVNQRQSMDSNAIEGLPSTDLVKTLSNDQEDDEKPNDIKMIFPTNPQVIQKGYNNSYFNDQTNEDNEDHENLMLGNYNDKIISIEEYTFSKNKKKKEQIE